MDEGTRERYLRSMLVASGLVFIFGIALLMRLWPAGFAWTPTQPEYEQMILGVYVTLGIFLLLASRAPEDHRNLILFAGWSSVVHGVIMGVQALRDPTERTHLIGDVPALVLVGIVFLVLAPRGRQVVAATRTQMSDATAPSGR
jgi:hypothetical protein